VDNLNFVSTGLTKADFDPYEQGHVIHARVYKGFRVAATCANSKHQGGVAVAWRVEAKGRGKRNFNLESFQHHGPNCLSYLCCFGAFKWPIVVAYLLPDTLEDLHHVQAAFDHFGPDRTRPMLMADLNVDLYSPSPDIGTRMVADFLAANGMEDMLQHFHSRRRFRHQKTWYQKRYNPDGTIQTTISSRTDCILTAPFLRCHFRNMQLVDPRTHKSDHYMIKATIKGAPRKAQRQYLQGRRSFHCLQSNPIPLPLLLQTNSFWNSSLTYPDPSRSSTISGQTGCQTISSNSSGRGVN